MQFNTIIGNPPYQGETIGENRTYAPPIYHLFMSEAYTLSQKAIFITPARFLFNTGSTGREWNTERLNDPHFKVTKYEPDASIVFPNTDIKGGVAVTIRNINRTYTPIRDFIPNKVMQSIVQTIESYKESSFSEQIHARSLYRLTEKPKDTNNQLINTTILGSNIFDKAPHLFSDEKPNKPYYTVYGRQNNQRVKKYIEQEKIQDGPNLHRYKVAIPQASGSGLFGERMGQPFILKPNELTTETFITIGQYESYETAESVFKYIQTKFARALLSVKKVTQSNTKDKWLYVPNQEFSDKSEIDWSLTIEEINWQLYRKYKLTQEQIDFLESGVREME